MKISEKLTAASDLIDEVGDRTRHCIDENEHLIYELTLAVKHLYEVVDHLAVFLNQDDEEI